MRALRMPIALCNVDFGRSRALRASDAARPANRYLPRRVTASVGATAHETRALGGGAEDDANVAPKAR